MTWRRHGYRLARAAAFLSRERRAVCVGSEIPRFLSDSATAAHSATRAQPLSPAVRYLVYTNSLDPSLIPASGPHSRLLKGDVLGYMASGMSKEKKASPSKATRNPSTTSPSQSQQHQKQSVVPVTNVQAQFTDITVDDNHRAKALSSVQSKVSVPQSSASILCQVGPLLSSLHHSGRERAMVLLESYFIKAAAATLKQLPHSNAVWNGDTLHLLPSVNVAVRVESEGRLLPAPVIIRDADRASVERTASVIEGAGSDSTPSVDTASLMVSSLLSSSLSHYVAVVQSPHSAVLSLAGVQTMLVEEEASATVAVCLSSDSRVLNSDLSSEWLQQFKTNFELLSSV